MQILYDNQTRGVDVSTELFVEGWDVCTVATGEYVNLISLLTIFMQPIQRTRHSQSNLV